MAREPSFPEEARVGEPAAAGPGEAASEAPRIGEAAQAAAAAKASDPRRARHLVAGAAIGIGSAALVAALLYANRSRKGERGEG
jgi:hypothetical protein